MTAEKLQDENKILEKRNALLEEREVARQSEIDFLKQMNEELTLNQKEYEVKLRVAEARREKSIKEKDAEMESLQSLNADMMSNIEALQQMIAVADQGGGTAIMAAPAKEESLQEKMRKAKEKKKKATGR